MRRAFRLAAVLLCGVALWPPPTAAQAEDEMPVRVGRVADLGGELYLSPAGSPAEWSPIALNYPVAAGDNLWVSGDGRAEIDFGGGQFRLAGDTNVHVSRLDERAFSLFVAQGRVILRVRALEPGEQALIDTPNTQVTLTRPGNYRIEVSPDRQETTVVVREGEAVAAVTNGAQQILPGQTATVFGSTEVYADVRNGTGQDGFDAWSAVRDREYSLTRSAAYVSPQMVGAADLDRYGTWQTYPDYGAVWFPTAVAVDWAPYRDGRWVFVSPWGWTWVDAAPWGYAPFHYGRWAYIGGRWGWCPGDFVSRPVWAPALVAWYGGSSWGLSVSAGRPVYGWVPLGWREPYVPSWRGCGSRCWTAYNRPYAVHVGERPRPPRTYVNQRVPGAITAVAGAAFAGGRPVARERVEVPGRLATSAPVLSAGPAVKPLPVTANVVRPGNGVPPPASTFAGRGKPMTAPAARAPDAGGGQRAAPIAEPRGSRLAAPSPEAGRSGAITAVPPATRRAPPYDAAATAGRQGQPPEAAGRAASPGGTAAGRFPGGVDPGASDAVPLPRSAMPAPQGQTEAPRARQQARSPEAPVTAVGPTTQGRRGDRADLTRAQGAPAPPLYQPAPQTQAKPMPAPQPRGQQPARGGTVGPAPQQAPAGPAAPAPGQGASREPSPQLEQGRGQRTEKPGPAVKPGQPVGNVP